MSCVLSFSSSLFSFFFHDTATTEIYTLSLHDALPIYCEDIARMCRRQTHRADQHVAGFAIASGHGDLVGRYCESDRKSTRLNSSHTVISYAVFCLKKKKKKT